MDGHSGLVPPVPISNTEVKQADVSGGTVLGTGDRIRCPLFLINYINYVLFYYHNVKTDFSAY